MFNPAFRAFGMVAFWSLLALPTTAQLVFIPDLEVRAVILDQAPGGIDANGYMDLADPALENVTWMHLSHTDTFDLTGTDQLPNLRSLAVSGLAEIGHLNIPGFAPSLTSITISSVDVISLPPLPANLDYLVLSDMPQLLQLPLLHPNIGVLTLGALPHVTDLTGLLPNNLRYLGLGPLDITTLPPLNDGLDTLRMGDLPLLTELPPMPGDLKWLELGDLPLVTAVPPISDGLVKVRFLNMPLTDIPAMGNTVEELELIQLDQLISISAFPGGPLSLTIDHCPALTTIPALQPGAKRLLLYHDQGINSIPNLPESLEDINFINVASVTGLPNCPDSLNTLWLQNCLNFEDLPSLANGLTWMKLNGCPALVDIPVLPDSLDILDCLDSPGVECLPALPSGMTWLSAGGSSISCLPNLPASLTFVQPAALTSSICDITTSPCPDGYPNASGTVFHDTNGNGAQDVGEAGITGWSIIASPGNALGGTDPQGFFDMSLPVDEYSLSCTSGMPYVVSISPSTHAAPLVAPNVVDSLNDFAITLVPDVHDLRISLTASCSRPGFQNALWATIRNVGTLAQDAEVMVVMDTAQVVELILPEPTSVSGDTIRWSIPGLPIMSTTGVFVFTRTPASVPIGTPLQHVASILPVENDTLPTDNRYTLLDTVVGSYDPNDKLVTPRSITPQQALNGTRVTYTIRFQNTGNFHAERVLLIDDLPATLDLTSFRFEGASHPHTWSIVDGELKVLFDGIMLPYASQNEPGSHGFFSFSIATLPDLADEHIWNRAFIYFDFNAPIITPWCDLSVEELPTSTRTYDGASFIAVPNPADDHLMIRHSQDGTITEVSLLSLDGRVIPVDPVFTGSQVEIACSRVPDGLYLLVVRGPSSQGTLRVAIR